MLSLNPLSKHSNIPYSPPHCSTSLPHTHYPPHCLNIPLSSNPPVKGKVQLGPIQTPHCPPHHPPHYPLHTIPQFNPKIPPPYNPPLKGKLSIHPSQDTSNNLISQFNTQITPPPPKRIQQQDTLHHRESQHNHEPQLTTPPLHLSAFNSTNSTAKQQNNKESKGDKGKSQIKSLSAIVKSSEWSKLPSDIWSVESSDQCSTPTVSKIETMEVENTTQIIIAEILNQIISKCIPKVTPILKPYPPTPHLVRQLVTPGQPTKKTKHHPDLQENTKPTQPDNKLRECFHPYEFFQSLSMWETDGIHKIYISSAHLNSKYIVSESTIPHYIADIGGKDLLSMQDGGSTANLVAEEELKDIPNKQKIAVTAHLTDYANNTQITHEAYIIPVRVPTTDKQGITIYETSEELFYPVKHLNSQCLLGRPLINSLSINDYKGLLTIDGRKIPTLTQPNLGHKLVGTVSLKHTTIINPETQLNLHLQPNNQVALDKKSTYMVIEHPACRQAHNSIFKNQWDFLNSAQQPRDINSIQVTLQNRSPYTRLKLPGKIPIGYIYKLNPEEYITDQNDISMILSSTNNLQINSVWSSMETNNMETPESSTQPQPMSSTPSHEKHTTSQFHFQLPKYVKPTDVPETLPTSNPSIFSKTNIPINKPLTSTHCYSCNLNPANKKLPQWASSISIDTDIPQEIRAPLLHLIDHYAEAFYDYQFEHPHCTCFPYNIKLKENHKISHRKPYPLPAASQAEGTMRQMVDQLVKDQVLRPLKPQDLSGWQSPVLIRPKGNGKYRFLADLRGPNSQSEVSTKPIRSLTEQVGNLASKRFKCTTDMKDYFHTFQCTPQTQKILTIALPWQSYCYNRMPQGSAQACAHGQAAAEFAFQNIENTSICVDDVSLAEDDPMLLLRSLEILFQRCISFGFKLTASKSKFFVKEVKCLGRQVGHRYHGITEETREKIKSIKTPNKRTELQSALGLLSYSRRYIPNFARQSQILTALLVDDTSHNTLSKAWTQDHENALRNLIAAIITSPAIQSPKEGPVELFIDSSKNTLAYLLGQKNKLKNGRYAHAYVAMNSKLIPREYLDDSMAHKEAMALQYAIEELYPLLLGREVHVFTDNQPVHNCLLKQAPASNKKTALTDLILCAQSLNIKPNLVHSKDNIADYNTRNAFTYLLSNILLPETAPIKKTNQQEHLAKAHVMTPIKTIPKQQPQTIQTVHVSHQQPGKPALPANILQRLETLYQNDNLTQSNQYMRHTNKSTPTTRKTIPKQQPHTIQSVHASHQQPGKPALPANLRHRLQCEHWELLKSRHHLNIF